MSLRASLWENYRFLLFSIWPENLSYRPPFEQGSILNPPLARMTLFYPFLSQNIFLVLKVWVNCICIILVVDAGAFPKKKASTPNDSYTCDVSMHSCLWVRNFRLWSEFWLNALFGLKFVPKSEFRKSWWKGCGTAKNLGWKPLRVVWISEIFCQN